MTRLARLATVLLAGATALGACSGGGGGQSTGTRAPSTPAASAPGVTATLATRSPGPTPRASQAPVTRPTIVTRHLLVPWSIVWLPDGTPLVSERETGRIYRIWADGHATVLMRLRVDAVGEGGLLGLAVSPSYAADGLLYAYFTTSVDNRIVRFRLGGAVTPVLTGIPRGTNHNGGRIAFGPDGMLYAGTGDATHRPNAQSLRSLGGKVLRMTPDGRPAPGNPFPGSVVFSLGHRNVQGLAWDRAGRLYATEFGQDTWDEINLIRPGRNYGWPVVEGRGGGSSYVDPLLTWRPDDASPSGAAIVGDALYVAALRGERLWRVPLDGDGGVGEPRALVVGAYGRLRDVAVGPAGDLWLLTSNRDGRGDPVADDDRVIRIPLPG